MMLAFLIAQRYAQTAPKRSHDNRDMAMELSAGMLFRVRALTYTT
jgi:hypothetical protein